MAEDMGRHFGPAMGDDARGVYEGFEEGGSPRLFKLYQDGTDGVESHMYCSHVRIFGARMHQAPHQILEALYCGRCQHYLGVWGGGGSLSVATEA